MYRNKGKPCGYVSWAWMSEAVEQKYILDTGSLLPEGWKSGDRGWLIDFIAPFGDTRRIVNDLKSNVFCDDVGRYLRVKPGSDTMQVKYVHGVNAIKTDNPTVDLKKAEQLFG
ncbi:toxin-activating lysine-acyltransferase [Amphritea balenae]|uniref:toxin-activating lysine-acyltransferase n=1 Tax=Amphritea balenae TaxID=452629 RepID=UPI001E47DA1A|nr:toxin-activating lysine-acyltransferase [Amphritea balenae]